MALDNSECLEEAGNVNDDDLEHDISDSEDNSDCYDDDDSDDSDCEVHDHSDIEGNDDLEDAPKKNESILRFEKEKAENTLILQELLKKVEGLTEDGMQMERHMRQLERLSQEKDRQICSAAAEMETLKNEISQKAKDTEKLVKMIEDKDSTLIILESTVAVLQMEKETLHHDLNEMENGRHATEAQLRKLNEDLESLRKENRRKQNRLESLQKENEHKTLRITELEGQLEVVAIQKQRADEDLQQLAECKAEIVDSKKELQKLNEQNLLQDREILRLENECSLKQREVIRLLKESKSIAAEEKANGKMNAMTKRIVQLEFELAETKDELDTMEFEKMEATIEIERLQEENMAKDKKITALEMEASVLKEKKDDETAKERDLTNKESEMFNEKKTMVKLAQIEEPAPERKVGKKNALAKTRSLRKPQIDCKALHRRIDTFEERLKQIMASEQHSVGTKRPSKAMAETPIKKPVNREDLHHKMRLESAARLKKLEEESKMVKNLYKINSVT
ncbi:flagellar attachment zone protein 1-like [Macrobrachium rosenbergii]|uniref:flagellar attachment zone protein 1-like n=1 Tax=Macrobrachium rosenbergii TaxID=79674 RepID=UPI0034D7AA06